MSVDEIEYVSKEKEKLPKDSFTNLPLQLALRDFSEIVQMLYDVVGPQTGRPSPLVSPEFLALVKANEQVLNSAIHHERDDAITAEGLKTFESLFLLGINGEIVERPQHFFMRVALGVHGEDIDAALEIYELLSKRYFIFSDAVLFNSGTNRPQLCSSYFLSLPDGRISSQMDLVKQCAFIAKSGGDVSVDLHSIPAKGNFDVETRCEAAGIEPIHRILEVSTRFVGKADNHQPGRIAVYLEPWHADIFTFLDMNKHRRCDEVKMTLKLILSKILTALWIPDLFMKRVEEDGVWSLMCPVDCPGLADCWGEDFKSLYKKYESEQKYRQQVKARVLWFKICRLQAETGRPSMLYKDACNRKSNLQHLGTLRGAGLNGETLGISNDKEIAVCPQASISLPRCVEKREGEELKFNFEKLHEVTRMVTRSLDKIIDKSIYPVEEAKRAALRHRRIGVGVQGLAEVFLLLRHPFTSPEARDLNKRIFETIYHAALEESAELAKEGGPHDSYEGSPMSKGAFQFRLLEEKPTDECDWKALWRKIARFGLRNASVAAQMPSSTSTQILDCSESTDPFLSNIFIQGEGEDSHQAVNPLLVHDLKERNLWSEQLEEEILASGSSVQSLALPEELKKLYLTAWEIPQKEIIEMAVDRAPFIDQSQALTIHFAEVNYAKITSMHFYGWKKGLKTGMSVLRTRPDRSTTKTASKPSD